MIRTRLEVDILELNGTETDSRNSKRPQLVVQEHPTAKRYVCLTVGDTKFSVDIIELETAVLAFVAINANRV